MKTFLVYSPVDGSIIGRFTITNDSQLEDYPNRLEVGKDITQKEFDEQPEIFYDVNTAIKKLINLSLSEVAKRLNVNLEEAQKRIDQHRVKIK